MSDDGPKLEPIPITELPPISVEEEIAWMARYGRVIVMTDENGVRRRVPEPWETGGERSNSE